jgi:hypothetical protein
MTHVRAAILKEYNDAEYNDEKYIDEEYNDLGSS